MRLRQQGQVASVLAKKPQKYWMPLSLSPITRCVSYIPVPPRGQAGHGVTSGPPAPEGQSRICWDLCSQHHYFLRPTSCEFLLVHTHSRFGPTVSFSCRSFEGNLNTYKRLSITMPDSKILKVGDDAACQLPEVSLTLPTHPVPGPPSCPGQCRRLPALGHALLAPGGGQGHLLGEHGALAHL